MLLAIGIVLAVIWLLCLVAFKVTVAAVHILVVLAVIALIAHFVRRRAPPPA
jgi:hypothetical protein